MHISLLDYGAGNVRSIKNAIERAGFSVQMVTSPGDLQHAYVVVFPGVGAFGSTVSFLDEQGYRAPLLEYLRSGRPFLGICLGMQTLFEGSEESPGAVGLGLIPGTVSRFPSSLGCSVPQIGWNGVTIHQGGLPALAHMNNKRNGGSSVYFVHSYRATITPDNAPWVACTTDYGGDRFISAVARGNIFATQFHPEKSGPVGLGVFKCFLDRAASDLYGPPPQPLTPTDPDPDLSSALQNTGGTRLVTFPSRRVIACLDVRSNDAGDLVVTKGDQYDVRERVVGGEGGDNTAASTGTGTGSGNKGGVRNLGKPVDLCDRYYQEGADEVVFLNITAFRNEPLDDTPMLGVLEAASERVFVPLTVGGGIRGYTDSKGHRYSALDVASRYFRAGADKVSIGSDAVTAAEGYIGRGRVRDGSSAIEEIAGVYGRQAVVVSIDPRRVWCCNPEEGRGRRHSGGGSGGTSSSTGASSQAATAAAAAGVDGEKQWSVDEAMAAGHTVITPTTADGTPIVGPGGERHCWYQCTIKGGREGRPLCAITLAKAVEELGAGEVLVNCVDSDGQKGGFDAGLLGGVCAAVAIPVIASSGAGTPRHFSDVFKALRVEGALAAGIFHRKEVAIADVKKHLVAAGLVTRSYS